MNAGGSWGDMWDVDERLLVVDENAQLIELTREQCQPGYRNARLRGRIVASALLRFEVERARGLLLAGAPLTRALPGRAGLELRLVVQGGLRILERIDACDGDVFRHRPLLAGRDWLVMGWRALRLPAAA